MSENILIRLKFFICLCFLLSFSEVKKPLRSKDLLPLNQFRAGEYFRYKIVYKFSEVWVTAGHVTFEFSERAVDDKHHTLCIAKGNTAPAFDIFYKVRDEYATILETSTCLPKYFLRRVNEGGFKIHNDFNFIHDSLRVIAEMQDSKTSHRIDTMPIPPNTQDIVSAILYCRTLDYNKLDSGQQYNFPIFLDNEVFHVGVKYHGKQVINTEQGEYSCLVLQPILLTGRIFSEVDKMRIYMTDDSRRWPVYIESPLKVGRIVAVMTKYKNGN